MNQILITGEEKVQVKKIKKAKKPFGINQIVIFYAISTIILGICMISGSVYAKDKINETVIANTKPSVQLNRNDDNNTVEINVSHIRGISTIAYSWNDEQEKIIDGTNQKQLTEAIDLLGGTNTLTVRVTEENGQSVTYKKQFLAGHLPIIRLEAVANGVKVIVTSDGTLDYITYSWDGGNEEKINVGESKYEGIINAPKGEHTLKIQAIDINGNKSTKEQLVVGDTAPTVNVEADIKDGKLIFIVEAEDDEQITTIEIIHNRGTRQVINVDEKTYRTEVEMTEGENRLLVTAYNKNGLSTSIGRIFKND